MRYVAHGYFAYVNEISFAYPEHLVHGGVAGGKCLSHGTWKVGTIWPMDFVFMSTFDDQSMSIG